jgi:hypothetical protein
MNETTQNWFRRSVLLVIAAAIAIIGGGYWWTHRGCTGYVANTHYAVTSRGRPTFLDLGRPYPNQEMTIVIWGSERAAFPQPPEVYYLHKTIHVRGRVTHYKGRPEIVVSSPNQIEIQE